MSLIWILAGAVQYRKWSPTANDPETANDPQNGPQMIPPLETSPLKTPAWESTPCFRGKFRIYSDDF